MSDLAFNGLNALTGEPLVSPADVARALARLRKGAAAPETSPGFLHWLRGLLRRAESPHWGLPLGLDAQDPAQAGWGIVFHEAEPAAVRDALAPLIEHRGRQLGAGKVKILEVRSGENWLSWLARHGVEAGSVAPSKVPYYLLLAGDPASIPFGFQNLLAVEYAVGRLSFDSPGEYGQYAASVIDYETGASVPNQRAAVFFGTRHDRATFLTADRLVRPLSEGLAEKRGFATRVLLAGDATQGNLADVFAPPSGCAPPALVFTATHGLGGYPCGHPEQEARQGALVCQSSNGDGRLSCFAGDDLPAGARVHGMICFHFACHGAGTPERDEYLHEPGGEPRLLADAPFVARLPRRLLAHPQGGALAVIGHVERAWGYSIVGASHQPQILPFQNTLGGLLEGFPVGHAVKDFRQRFAALSTALAETLEKISFGATVPDAELAALWIQRNDARNYAVLGDPAVRLRVDDLQAG